MEFVLWTLISLSLSLPHRDLSHSPILASSRHSHAFLSFSPCSLLWCGKMGSRPPQVNLGINRVSTSHDVVDDTLQIIITHEIIQIDEMKKILGQDLW